MKKSRKQRLRNAFKGRYLFLFVLIFFLYIGLNVYLNELYVSLDIWSSYNMLFLIPFALFNFLIVPFLIALTVNLSVLRFKEAGTGFDFKDSSKASVGGIGALSGLVAGACPGCFVGLFPAFAGFFGINAGLSSLPFLGLELQALSALLLLTAAFLLTKDITCEVNLEKDKK